MRLLTALTIVTLAFMASAPAQESRSAAAPSRQAEKSADWQSVITKQIEAFRAEDGAGALSCAAELFRKQYTEDPSQFYEFITNNGFMPIAKSNSHAFGEFKMADDQKTVLQIVTITGRDQRTYKTIYEMGLESGGWKVQGVAPLMLDESVVT